MGISIWQLIIIVLLLIVGVLPWVMALASKKASGSVKFIWFLSSFFFSWIGYIVYYFAVVKNLNPDLDSQQT